MKKLLILTLTFIISISSFISCNDTQSNEQANSENSSTNKQEAVQTPNPTVEKDKNSAKKVDSEQPNQTETNTPKETKKQISNSNNKSTKNNIESKEISNNNLQLFGISDIETDGNFYYTLKTLGSYSKDKLHIDSNNNLYGFITKDISIKNPTVDSFKYNEVIALFGHIKYPNFLNLNTQRIPVSFAGFEFKDSTGQINFKFNCDEPYIDPQTNENYSVDHIYNVMTDTSLNPKCKITYKAKGKDWVCVSSEEDGIITYYLVKLKKDTNTSFSYTYPKKYEKLFDPIIQESYTSFKTDTIVKNT